LGPWDKPTDNAVNRRFRSSYLFGDIAQRHAHLVELQHSGLDGGFWIGHSPQCLAAWTSHEFDLEWLGILAEEAA
jgi:hypothetical protein